MSGQSNSKIKEILVSLCRNWSSAKGIRNDGMKHANRALRRKYKVILKKQKDMDKIQYGAGWLD